MFTEAAEAPAAVERMLAGNAEIFAALGRRLREAPPELVLTCARGSSDHAATFAKYLIETRTGTPVASAAPSTASVYGVAPRLRRTLCLAVSQSGASPDLLATVDAAVRAGASVAALVNVADSPLGERADWLLPLHAGPERSVAATKSFIASLAALLQIVSAWTQDASDLGELPALLAQSWECDWSPLVEGLRDARGLYVLGRGLGLGAAQEAALKLKETSGLHAEAFSTAEVRHGPMALVGPDFPLLVFRQPDETAVGVETLAADAAARGTPVFVAGGAVPGAIALPTPDASAAATPLLQVQSFYRAAAQLAVARGFDPDRPPHLSKVTETV
ncbi:SIS domain-containing protein [Sphingomonas sp. MAH-20]|uniref:SIS domain-containing protein n=2 Tax=Sphingomonadaceae TaxID=41297 RepID=A0A6I4J3M9_9SPHN|nr:SIS domain-containing protein [Sphingomonas horti]MBA2918894.1 SIS domain-containing protein [Sphingomonas sp. CGMCC 1.13658]MVO78927.1 SIS domain-containing protein [Sphingomonas horti]